MSNNYLHWHNNEDDKNIPKGKAMIWMNNNGCVGTNNGWPLLGQPALYPESQAITLCHAWNVLVMLGEEKAKALFPNPSGIQKETWDWLFKSLTLDHTI